MGKHVTESDIKLDDDTIDTENTGYREDEPS